MGGRCPCRGWARRLAAHAQDPAVSAELPAWTAILDGGDAPLAARPLDAALDIDTAMERVSVPVPAELTSALLTSVPAAFHSGIDDVLLAGLAVAVTDWRRQRGGSAGPVLVDVESHGRDPGGADDVDLSRTVGWFTSIYPVRLDTGTCALADVTAGGPAAGQAVRQVKEQFRAVPGTGLGYGLLRYLNPDTGPALAALPAPQIGFNYLGRFMGGSPAGEHQDWQLVGGGLSGPARTPARHVLEVGGITRELPDGPQLTLTLSCPRELIPAEAAQELGQAWLAALSGIARHATQHPAGGHTPSDFPLLDLTQDEIDEFEDLAGGMTGEAGMTEEAE